MFDHSLNLDPEEACGVLLGNKNQVSKNVRINNIHEEPLTRYTMDPNELLKVTLEAEKKDLDIINKIRILIEDKNLVNMVGCNLRFHPKIMFNRPNSNIDEISNELSDIDIQYDVATNSIILNNDCNY